MRIFIFELKKLWNWRILLVIAAFGVITWFAFLADILDSYESLKTHGIYGAYQTEMFKLYGETLEPHEWNDFNIQKKYADIYTAGDTIIAAEPLFAKYDIATFSEFIAWYESESYWVFVDGSILVNGVLTPENQDRMDMQDALYGVYEGVTLDEWYSSPLVMLGCLRTLEDRYTNQQEHLDIYTLNDLRPAVVRAAERLSATGNNSLINGYLMQEFSLHAAVTGVFALVSIMILIIPLLIIDRSRKINLLQYSSAVGRKIFRVQFSAAIISAIVLSGILTVVSFAVFLSRTAEYWNTSIMSLGGNGMWMYDVTFGQYVIFLGGMIISACVGTACFAFILARFSANIVTVMIKSVPVGAALAAILALSVNMAFSYNNIVFNQVFVGRVDMSEVVICGAMGVIGVIAGGLVVRWERWVDLG
ncbi:MAG: hypothetical protein FWH20_07060 [Oscillospiraceae bacterium]|nr:hypothetical protein [Oscillospiraceae bacterium]